MGNHPWAPIRRFACYPSLVLWPTKAASKTIPGWRWKVVLSGPGELDPELIRLPRTRMRVSPIAAFAVGVLCIWLMIRLMQDALYSTEGNVPQDVVLNELADGPSNRYVSTKTTLDFSNIVRLRQSLGEQGRRFARVRGTNNKVWAILPGDAFADESPTGPLQGRLLELGRLHIEGVVKEFFSTRAPVWTSLPSAEVKRALGEEANSLVDFSGDVVSLSGDSRVRLSRQYQDRVLVICSRTQDYKEEAMWRAALVALELITFQGEPMESGDWGWAYEVKTQGGVDAVNSVLKQNNLFAAKAQPMTQVYDRSWKELSTQGDEIILGDNEIIRWSDVQQLLVSETLNLPPDAKVLILNESPTQYWYVPWACLALGLSACLMFWASFREIKFRLN